MITDTDIDDPLVNAVAHAIAVQQRKDPYPTTEPTDDDMTQARPLAQAALNAVINYQPAETNETTADEYEILDPELVAIATVVEVLEPLQTAQRTRIIAYLTDRYLPTEHATATTAVDSASQPPEALAEPVKA